MNQKYLVPLPEGADEAEMTEQAKRLNLLLKLNVRLVKSLAFELDHPNAAEIVKAIVTVSFNGRTKGKKTDEAIPVMSRAAYRFVTTGEVITTRALNKRFVNGDHELQNSVVENHKGQRFVILPDDNGMLSLIREPQA